jgi:hypothetical protein
MLEFEVLVHTRQVLYLLNYIPSSFVSILFLRKGFTANLVQVGLELLILLPPYPE